MNTADRLAQWADKLRDLSALGLRYAGNRYEHDRYRAIQDVAVEMLAAATGDDVESFEPLRAPVLARPTPFAVGDAAIFDDPGRILLVRRADNGLWAMPGGALEVGETPAEGVLREAMEETGVACTAAGLVGVFDSRLRGTTSRHHMYHFVFLCRLIGGAAKEPPSHANEVIETAWYHEAELPSDLDPGHQTRIPEAFRAWRGDGPPFFDWPG